jgi:hypothetical protein
VYREFPHVYRLCIVSILMCVVSFLMCVIDSASFRLYPCTDIYTNTHTHIHTFQPTMFGDPHHVFLLSKNVQMCIHTSIILHAHKSILVFLLHKNVQMCIHTSIILHAHKSILVFLLHKNVQMCIHTSIILHAHKNNLLHAPKLLCYTYNAYLSRERAHPHVGHLERARARAREQERERGQERERMYIIFLFLFLFLSLSLSIHTYIPGSI